MLKRGFLLLLLLICQNVMAATIHGFVKEKDNHEPIIMGNVWIKDSAIGTATNMKGYYVLSALPPGTYEVFFRYIGFETYSEQVTVKQNDDFTLDVELKPEALMMQATEVVAERDKRELDIKPSQISMAMPRLKNVATVAEADLFRAIQMLPGVATLSDFSAGLYIRGGSPDQNLILLDGIDVYNPNHMFGFFSTFNTDAIKSVELLKGGFPAKYGGRLSSVLNVYNKEGNRKEFQGVTRLSILSASTTLEGPWQHGSWMISGRRTYLDLAGKLADVDLPYYFYDGHAHINYDVDKNNLVGISLYLGNDVLNLSQGSTDIVLNWGNKTFSTQWTHLFNSQLFSHFIFAGSRFDSDARIDFDEVSFGFLNEVTDIALKGTLTYTPSTRHSIDFGFEMKDLNFKLNYKVLDINYINETTGRYYSLFVQDNFKITPLTIVQSGIRLDHYSAGEYTRFDPRLSIKRVLTENSHVTASYGRYHQFLNQVQQEGMSFADSWFSVDETFEPGIADHYILGYTFDNKQNFSIELEGYYKDYKNIAEYRSYRQADEDYDSMKAAQNFLSGKGYAYGGDIYLRNHFWKLEGWFGYSLSWTRKKIDGYNFGNEYYPTYDRRHTITAIQDIRFSDKWRLNLAFKYGSGQPYTEAAARYLVMDPTGRTHSEVLDGEKNAYRLPDYHRFDIGIFHNRKIFGLDSEIFVQLVNVYNHKNVWYRRYQVYDDISKREDYTMIPFLPTAGISINF